MNIYQIKIQAQLKGKNNGTIFFPGIVVASTQEVAVKITKEKIKDEFKTKGIKDYDLKLFSCSRMNAEFILYEPKTEKAE